LITSPNRRRHIRRYLLWASRDLPVAARDKIIENKRQAGEGSDEVNELSSSLESAPACLSRPHGQEEK